MLYEVITIAHLTSVNPSTCSGTNGSIVISGLENSTEYSVDYKKNTVAVATVITSYSIHYTKLYDDKWAMVAVAGSLRLTGPAMVLDEQLAALVTLMLV